MRGRTGDPKRIWISDADIETRVEAELTRAALMPAEATPAVNIERFVEKHLRATLDTYADLAGDVLGQTEFARDRPPHVRINRALTERAFDDPETPPGAEGRWRATVAHEAAHVMFHAQLFTAPPNLDLFSAQPSEGILHRCELKDVLFRGRASDWKEIQANRGMAALLMPRSLFVRVARQSFHGALGTDSPTPAEAARLIPHLAGLFNVSKQALGIRLETLGLLADGRQRSL
jgi:hypothetical protein